MNLVVDFLLEYYVWILVVLVILLITVIGFLVDTKRKKKLRQKADSGVNAPASDANLNNNMNMMGQNLNTFEPNMNQNMNNFNDGMNNDIFNPNMNAFDVNMNQNMNTFEPNMNLGMNTFNNNLNNNMLNQNIVEPQNNMMTQSTNLETNVNNDAFFVPTSQQSPMFEPGNVVIPKPVENTPIMGSTPTPVIEPVPVQNANTNVMSSQGMNIESAPIGIMPNSVSAPMPTVNQMPIQNMNNMLASEPVSMPSAPVVEPQATQTPVEAPAANTVVTPSLDIMPNIASAEVPTVNQMPIQNMNNVPATEPVSMPSAPVEAPVVNTVVTPSIDIMPNVVNEPVQNGAVNVLPNQNANNVVPPVVGTPNMVEAPVINPMPVMNNNMPNAQTINQVGTQTPVNSQMPTGNDNWQL